MFTRLVLGLAGVVAMLAVLLAPTASSASSSTYLGVDCIGPAPNAAPGTSAWKQRDLDNVVCSTQRQAEELTNPANAQAVNSQIVGIYASQTLTQLEEPGHLHLSVGQILPAIGDAFRTISLWTASGRGRVTPISFRSSDGATLNGYLFEPPARVPGPYPGIVITTGSLQAYQQVYFWAAEGLAEAGYEVLTYDVQGQGDSDTFPADCTLSSCPGVPFQQNYNFFQGTEDALNFFLSTPSAPYRTSFGPAAHNPAWAALDPTRIGIAGHSLGADAVSEVAQCDTRVRAVVAWDDLSPATGPCSASVTVPTADAVAKPTDRVPALGFNSEYFLNPEPMSSQPSPHAKDDGYRQLAAAGDDTMQVALRESTHLEYAYIPLLLPASALGERVAFFYTLAWFDYYLRDMPQAYARLVSTRFDDSSDLHSIGAGSYSPALGNIPPRIAGLPVANRLSFYYESEYTLSPPLAGGGPDPTAAHATCVDMRAGCPAKAPPTP